MMKSVFRDTSNGAEERRGWISIQNHRVICPLWRWICLIKDPAPQSRAGRTADMRRRKRRVG